MQRDRISALGRSGPFLDLRGWVYVLSLLVPLVAYGLAIKVLGLVSEYPASGAWETLRLLRSELLFGAGYALVWIGALAASRGMLRRVVLALFHVSAVLVVVVETASYQYFRSTGTTLDYAFVAYYLAKPGEAQGAVASAAPPSAWLALSAALLYALLGPMLVTGGHVPTGPSRPGSPGAEARRTSGGGGPQGRELTRGSSWLPGWAPGRGRSS